MWVQIGFVPRAGLVARERGNIRFVNTQLRDCLLLRPFTVNLWDRWNYHLTFLAVARSYFCAGALVKCVKVGGYTHGVRLEASLRVRVSSGPVPISLNIV